VLRRDVVAFLQRRRDRLPDDVIEALAGEALSQWLLSSPEPPPSPPRHPRRPGEDREQRSSLLGLAVESSEASIASEPSALRAAESLPDLTSLFRVEQQHQDGRGNCRCAAQW
jgi:hypothetical protein